MLTKNIKVLFTVFVAFLIPIAVSKIVGSSNTFYNKQVLGYGNLGIIILLLLNMFLLKNKTTNVVSAIIAFAALVLHFYYFMQILTGNIYGNKGISILCIIPLLGYFLYVYYQHFDRYGF